MLPFGRDPRALPNGYVDELRVRLDAGEFSEEVHDQILYKFVPQQIVVALTGPMRDVRGRFLRNEKGCGIVLGYLLGREVEYKVPLHQLQVAEQTRSGPSLRSTLRKVA